MRIRSALCVLALVTTTSASSTTVKQTSLKGLRSLAVEVEVVGWELLEKEPEEQERLMESGIDKMVKEKLGVMNITVVGGQRSEGRGPRLLLQVEIGEPNADGCVPAMMLLQVVEPGTVTRDPKLVLPNDVSTWKTKRVLVAKKNEIAEAILKQVVVMLSVFGGWWAVVN